MTHFPNPIYVHAAVRSPIGKFGGGLRSLKAAALAGELLKSAVGRHPVRTDGVILGHARQAGAGPNPSRQAAILAGLDVPAWTINQACASGMASVISAIEKISVGKGDAFWAGGVESMSSTPYYLERVRFGMKLGHQEVVDGMFRDGFYCPMSEMLMGETVERVLVPEFRVSREEQDAFALQSHKRAAGADFKNEIIPIAGCTHDEVIRPDLTADSLKRLPPVFDSEGTLTAGNSSAISDGAAWLAIGKSKTNAIAEILDYETVSLDPVRMGLGPVPAIERLLKRSKLTQSEISAVEINEAFAAQVIACQRTLKIPLEQLNPKGGAIALGHPIGATGARILVTLIHTLREKKPGSLGIAALCVSGGQGVAMLVRSV